MSSNTPAEDPTAPGYEKRDASVPIVGWTVAGVGAGVVLCLIICSLYYKNHYKAGEFVRETNFENSAAAQSSIAQAWPAIERANDDHLHRYAWVDRKNGVVQIPIDRAMELVAKENAAATGKEGQ